jgi:hypothetical protein
MLWNYPMIFFTSFKYLQIFFVLSTDTIFLTTREITLLKNVKNILIILESNQECADGLVTDITKVTTGVYIYIIDTCSRTQLVVFLENRIERKFVDI